MHGSPSLSGGSGLTAATSIAATRPWLCARGAVLRWLSSLAATLPLLALGQGKGVGATAPLSTTAAEEVCVIAPRLESDPRGGGDRAVVPFGRPTLFAVGEMKTARLERGGRVVWQVQGTPEAPLRGPIPWPVAPIRPGETVMLRLRPLLAPPGDFAAIPLIGAPQPVMERAEGLLRRLGKDPAAWLEAFEQALERNDLALAWGLLFAFEGPSSPELDALRLEVYHRGCGAQAPPGPTPPS